MAETKTGLESVLGWVDQSGTLGGVYYNSLTGSAGTKNLGVGTAYTNGSRAVYFGSGLAVCAGVMKVVSQGTGTVAASTSTGSYTAYNIEAGSDTTVDLTAGTQGATVAAAIEARAGTQAGHVQIGYVTVGNPGSVLAGSIVDERTLLPATGLSYVTGLSYDQTDDPLHVYDGTTYAHSKAQRLAGKFTYKQVFEARGSTDIWAGLLTNYHTKPRIAIEENLLGIAGTTECVNLLVNCVKETESYEFPETESVTADVAGFFGSMLTY